MTRVAVALSGGVDSAVAAARLVRRGFEVVAIHGKEWSGNWAGSCPGAADAEAARAVAACLGIPLTVVNCEAAYRQTVFEQYLAELSAGRTPNPDVWCNPRIKFGVLADAARRIGASALASGHYARRVIRRGRAWLRTGVDAFKDQSYFLAELSTAQLAFARFPLGHSRKSAVRMEARRLGLPVADRPDSMGLCFVGPERFPTFLRAFIPDHPGATLDERGVRVGSHPGTHRFTIGQRHGLGLSGGPYYVAAKDSKRHTLTVVRGRSHPRLLARAVSLDRLHWISTAPTLPRTARVRFRHQQPLIPARVRPEGEGIRVTFGAPAWAATPGQFLAIYAGSTVLGGGAIDRVHP